MNPRQVGPEAVLWATAVTAAAWAVSGDATASALVGLLVLVLCVTVRGLDVLTAAHNARHEFELEDVWPSSSLTGRDPFQATRYDPPRRASVPASAVAPVSQVEAPEAQAAVPRDVLSAPHLVARLLHEAVYYPAHPPRVETAAYARIHHQMVVVEDQACLVCGVRNSTLKDPTHNRVGARAVETHHWIIEHSLANAIDVEKFNRRVLPRLHREHPDDPEYQIPFTQERLSHWVDHSRHNLRCICDVHHRHSLVGIHSVTFPIWTAQDLLLDDFQFTPDQLRASAPAPLPTPPPTEAT